MKTFLQECLSLLLYTLRHVFWSVSLLDTIIVQVQQWGVVGAQRVVDQVLLNGVSLTDASQEVDNIVQAISADALLPTLISVNQSLLPSKKITIFLE